MPGTASHLLNSHAVFNDQASRGCHTLSHIAKSDAYFNVPLFYSVFPRAYSGVWWVAFFPRDTYGDKAVVVSERENEFTRAYAEACLEVAHLLHLPSINLWAAIQSKPDWQRLLRLTSRDMLWGATACRGSAAIDISLLAFFSTPTPMPSSPD